MAYLNKEERKNEILTVAIHVAITEGLSSITARNLSKSGNFAIGQIHHHFKSISELKSQTLSLASDYLIECTKKENQNEDTLEKIYWMLCPIDGETGIQLRKLWSEAVFIAQNDEEMKAAYKQSILDWHGMIVHLIEKGQKETVIPILNNQDVAWQLIGLSCGFDSIFVVEEFRMTQQKIRQYINEILKIF